MLNHENISDAIKIVAPALITALATYFAMRLQLKIKLEEIREDHNFQARTSLFQYAKERYQLEQCDYEKVQGNFSILIGRAVGSPGNTSAGLTNKTEMAARMLFSESQSLGHEIELSKTQLKEAGLIDEAYSNRLDALARNFPFVKVASNLPELESNIAQTMEIRSYLSKCRQAVYKKAMDRILAPYLKNGK
jgi:hypothetical protein